MDGAKPAADTAGRRGKTRRSGRRTTRLGGSGAVTSRGPTGCADPGSSNSIDGLKSRPPKGQGFLSDASSAKSQSVLRPRLTANGRKGKRFIFRYRGNTPPATDGAPLTVPGKPVRAVALAKRITLGRAVKARTRRRREWRPKCGPSGLTRDPMKRGRARISATVPRTDTGGPR